MRPCIWRMPLSSIRHGYTSGTSPMYNSNWNCEMRCEHSLIQDTEQQVHPPYTQRSPTIHPARQWLCLVYSISDPADIFAFWVNCKLYLHKPVLFATTLQHGYTWHCCLLLLFSCCVFGSAPLTQHVFSCCTVFYNLVFLMHIWLMNKYKFGLACEFSLYVVSSLHFGIHNFLIFRSPYRQHFISQNAKWRLSSGARQHFNNDETLIVWDLIECSHTKRIVSWQRYVLPHAVIWSKGSFMEGLKIGWQILWGQRY